LFTAGENRSYVSTYSPLGFVDATIQGRTTEVSPGRERGRNVYSIFTKISALSSQRVRTNLAGSVRLDHGWYEVQVRHQPTLKPDRLRVSVEVPDGWRIDRAPHLVMQYSRLASTSRLLERTATFRVHVVRDPGTWNLWERLRAGV